MFKRFSSFLILISLSIGLLSCSDKSTTDGPNDGESTMKVGVTLLTMTHPFFLEMIKGLEMEAENNNFEIQIVSAEFDVAKQQNQVSDFIVQGVDAIILCPADSRAIGTTIQQANEAGIPVFTADIASLAGEGEVQAHVGIDNLMGGRMAGELAIKALGESGKIAIIDHPEVESVILRTRGFNQVINEAREAGSKIEVVSTLPAGGSQDRAFRVAEDVLQAHPDLDLIFGINDETALGAVAAIEKAGKSETVRVIGLGGKKEAIEAVDSGRLYADVQTNPDQIGILSIQRVAQYFAGESIEKETRIPTVAYVKK